MSRIVLGVEKHLAVKRDRARRWIPILAALLLCAIVGSTSWALEIQVEGPDGAPVTGFRWLVEEDPTHAVEPGVSCMGADLTTCPSVGFHPSYAPVVAAGDSSNPTIVALPADRRYFVSVLPDAGYANSGAPVAVGQSVVKVLVQPMPWPTAQIRILVFEDNFPINNAPDTPNELGLEGFDVLLFEAGGRYGVSGGLVSQDAFGNPLGTTYLPNGDVNTLGSGVLKTDADGVLVIKNLSPAKYGIQAVPPPGQKWIQTATIEGTKTIDAWVKANEPSYFTEFGPPGPHVFIGFVREFKNTAVLNGGATISGQIRSIHTSRPPNFAFFTGAPVPVCWVGLNEGAAAPGQALYAGPCNDDSTFAITGVPAGDYTLGIWDANLDYIFASQNVTVSADAGGVPQDLDLQDIPIFNWNARLETWVFNDVNRNGFRDCVTVGCDNPLLDEVGIPEVPVNLRFRDGTIYQSFPTDSTGFLPFDEVFPFFHWLVAEVDFARLWATGGTFIVDAGGPVDPDQGWTYPSRDLLTPQPQCVTTDPVTGNCIVPDINPNTGNNTSRTELSTPTAPVLLEGFQAFLGQTSIMEFGKASFLPGENGGITGVISYATTRAEDDPAYAVAEEWEPGIPRVQVNLYRDLTRDGVIDDLNGDGVTPADVDNYPFGWRDGGAIGPEDVDRDGDTLFDAGDALQIITSDSWDDNLPSGCQGAVFEVNGVPTDCYDGLRNFNQVRPGALFDGGYGFFSYFPGGIASGSAEVDVLPSGGYVVEANAPPGYHHLKEEDRNVDFGIEYQPAPLLLPPPCVGDLHLVPNEFSLFPLLDDNNVNVPPLNAGNMTPLCDRKKLVVKSGLNPAANFFLFTEAPIAGHVRGFILNDVANEFDPNAPTFGEKQSPPFLPISIRDWTGREISRTYSDRWGVYEALVPSTYSVNLPMPSGVSPSMMTACMNSPGPIPNPTYDPMDPASPQYIVDPFFQKQYSQFCYTLQYMPGTTTYLDTPVVSVAAFAGPGNNPLDCEFGDGTPVIWSASSSSNGPYVSAPGQQITIVAAGPTEVPNPAYDINLGTPKTIMRDYGFGTMPGTVTIGGIPLGNVMWSAGAITGTVQALPGGETSGLLEITRGDNGLSAVTGVTVTVGPIAGSVHPVQPAPYPATPIQDAIDLASPGDLILVSPGVYEELVIMWKPVKLQGWGAASTTINAVKVPGEKLQAWWDRVNALITAGDVDLLPSQEIDFALPEPATLFTEAGPGIVVLARDVNPNNGGFGLVGGRPNARIDGLGITGADQGGGIFVNAFARRLVISNNRVFSNVGTYGGGIRVGHPLLFSDAGGTFEYDDAQNDLVDIHHNQVIENGGLLGAGGGISMCNGSNRYSVTHNYVCGNYTGGDGGGGIGHLGLSRNGQGNNYAPNLIAHNTILFNQSFNQDQASNGGGIFIGSAPPLNGVGSLPEGTGSVVVLSNLIQGNQAGAGDGGGLRAAFVNGQDIGQNGNQVNNWYSLDVINNIIVDNGAGLAGGGISLQDSARVNIINNTIANNESTATAGAAFAPGSPNLSTPQPGGIVSRAHTAALAAEFGPQTDDLYGIYSNPLLYNNIIRHNRSFQFWIDPLADPPEFGLLPDVGAGDPAIYDDLAVLGTAAPAFLNPNFCILSETTDQSLYNGTNKYPGPTATLFIAEYFNGDRGQTIQMPEATTSIQAAPAFDEGGNFIEVRFGPLTFYSPMTGLPFGNYHIVAGSQAVDGGSNTLLPANNNDPFLELLLDFDDEDRPNPGTDIVDVGADELY